MTIDSVPKLFGQNGPITTDLLLGTKDSQNVSALKKF